MDRPQAKESQLDMTRDLLDTKAELDVMDKTEFQGKKSK